MKKINLLLTIFCLSLIIMACKKPGCTDPDATNYNPAAKNDNINCTFEGSVLFWFDAIYADSLDDLDIRDSLFFFIDDREIDIPIGSKLIKDEFSDTEPECGKKGVVSYTSALGKANYRFVEYRVEDELGFIQYEGLIRFEANECLKIQLE